MPTASAPPMPEWAPPDGPWCLMQWIPFGVPDPKVDVCLLSPEHNDDCRGIHGNYYSDKNAMFVGVLQPRSIEPPEVGTIWLYPGEVGDPYSRVFVEIKPPQDRADLNPCFYAYGFGAIECDLPAELVGLTLERWDALVHSKKLLPLGELDKLIPKES